MYALLLEREVLDDVLLAATQQERLEDVLQLRDEQRHLFLLGEFGAVRRGDLGEVELRLEQVLIIEDVREDEREQGVEFGEVVLLRGTGRAASVRLVFTTRSTCERTYQRSAGQKKAEIALELLEARERPVAGKRQFRRSRAFHGRTTDTYRPFKPLALCASSQMIAS